MSMPFRATFFNSSEKEPVTVSLSGPTWNDAMLQAFDFQNKSRVTLALLSLKLAPTAADYYGNR